MSPPAVSLPDRRKFPSPPLLPPAILWPPPCRKQKWETCPSHKEPSLIQRDCVCWELAVQRWEEPALTGAASGLPQGPIIMGPKWKCITKRDIQIDKLNIYPDRTISQQLFFENLLLPLCCVSSAWKGELSPCVCVCVCVVKYMQHKIDHSNQFVAYTSVALNIFTLYNYHHLFILSYSETPHIMHNSVRIPTCPQPLATTFLSLCEFGYSRNLI